MPVDAALSHARQINLQDERPLTGGMHPLESFLGRNVPEMKHVKP
jgi:hypothetical protein